MPTALDLIGSNSALQEHWIRRVIAILVDAIVVGIFLTLLSLVFAVFAYGFLVWPLFSGLIWVLYATFLEVGMGATLGKKLLSLHVVGIDAPLDAAKALIRNISKIHPVILLIDWVFGFVTQGDPRQRYLDRIARTTVTRVDQQAYMEEQFRQMQHVPPHPTPPPGGWPQAAPPQPPAGGAGSPGTAPQQGAQGWPAQPGVWPGSEPKSSDWPQHRWDEEGQLKPQSRFCTSCGGQLVPRGDGRLTCVRCGLVY